MISLGTKGVRDTILEDPPFANLAPYGSPEESASHHVWELNDPQCASAQRFCSKIVIFYEGEVIGRDILAIFKIMKIMIFSLIMKGDKCPWETSETCSGVTTNDLDTIWRVYVTLFDQTSFSTPKNAPNWPSVQ